MRVKRLFIEAKKTLVNEVDGTVEVTHELDNTGKNFGPFHSLGKSIPSYGLQPLRSKDRKAEPAFDVEAPSKILIVASKEENTDSAGLHLDSLAWKIF
jgi:hypothetical protein